MKEIIGSRNRKKWFRPVYHGIYIFFIILEVTVFCYYFLLNDCCNIITILVKKYNEFRQYSYILKLPPIKDTFKFSTILNFSKICNIQNIIQEFTSFSSMLGMQAICTAIIIFLYSKYSEGSHGIPSDFLIEHLLGKRTVFIYRVTSLLLPCVSLIFNYIGWVGIAIVSAVFMYYIIGVYVFLVSKLMQREKTSKLIKEMLKKEIKDKEEVYKTYILEDLSYGYLKCTEDNKIILQTKMEIRQELKSELMSLVFNESNQYELDTVVKTIYEEIVELNTSIENINFIYMYDLVSGILEVAYACQNDWKLETINQIITILDNKDDAENKDGKYDVLYFAIICAILHSGKRDEKEYLWNGLIKLEEQRNFRLARELFLSSWCFLEILRRKQMKDTFSQWFLKQNSSKFNEFYYFTKYFEISESIKKCSFALAVIIIDREEYIIECFKDIEEDTNKYSDKNHAPKTMLGINKYR